MAAEVEDINGVEVAGDGDKGKATGRLGEHDGAADIYAVHRRPTHRWSRCDGDPGSGSRDQVLPAAQMIGGADGIDFALIWNAGGAEAHGVDADAIELADYLRSSA